MVSKAQRDNLQRQQSSASTLRGNARGCEGRARWPGTARPRRTRAPASEAARSAAQRQNNDASNCSGTFLTRQPRGNGRASRRAARLGAGWARAGKGAGRVSARAARRKGRAGSSDEQRDERRRVPAVCFSAAGSACTFGAQLVPCAILTRFESAAQREIRIANQCYVQRRIARYSAPNLVFELAHLC